MFKKPDWLQAEHSGILHMCLYIRNENINNIMHSKIESMAITGTGRSTQRWQCSEAVKDDLHLSTAGDIKLQKAQD